MLIAAALPALAGVLLQIASRAELTPDSLFLAVDAMVGLVYGTVAAVILSRRSHPVAWLTALTAVGGGLATLGGGWASFAMARDLPADDAGIFLFGSAWVPGTLALFLVVPWLVRETPLPRSSTCGLAVGIAVTLALTVQRLVFPMSDNTWVLIGVVTWGLVTAATVHRRHRFGPVDERNGLGLLALGTAVMAASFLPLLLVPYTSTSVLFLVPISHLACQALFPGALLVTVLRNRLWGIDLAVSRGVLAGLLTLIMVIVYAALVWTASSLVGNSTIAQLVAAVGVVLAVQPIRSSLDARVRRLVWGEAASAGRAALQIGASLTTPSRPAELLDRLAAAIGETLRLESVTLTLPDGATAGHWGTPTSPPLERAMVRSPATGAEAVAASAGTEAVTANQSPTAEAVGAELGTLTFTPRPGERLDRRTFDALARVEPLLAVGLSLIRATAEVTEAKDAATQARDVADRAREATSRARLAERQLIRRELHDGIGPWLSGLHLGIQGARNVLRSDPQTADEVLEALQNEAAQRVQDIRLFSRSLLPPVLEERGLAAAVEQLASRYAQTGFTLKLGGLLAHDPNSLRGLDARVTAAAYAVIAESSLNSSRYAGVDDAEARVEWTDDPQPVDAPRGIVVECRDYGVGRAPDSADGVGTRSMRERVEELGGRFSIGPAEGGGTLVRTQLPLVPLEVSP